MGVLQGAVNQALVTAGTLAGLGKLVKSQEKSVDLQEEAMKKAESRFAEEQKVKELKAQKMEQTGKDLLESLPRTEEKKYKIGTAVKVNPEYAKEQVYVSEQLEKQYLELGDIQKAAQFRRAQTRYGDLLTRQEQANANAKQRQLAKQEQKKRMEEFRSKFTEGGRYK